MRTLDRLNTLRAKAKDGQTWRDVRRKPSSYPLGCWTVAPYTEERRSDNAPKSWRWLDAPIKADLLRYVGDAVVERRPYREHLVRGDNGGATAPKHNGWYTDNWQFETTSGVVFQLTAKDGQPRYVAGVRDAYGNWDSFCVELCETFDDEKEAANRADDYAKWFAELCREDDAKQTAEQRIEDIGEELATLRRDVRQAIAEFRRFPKVVAKGVTRVPAWAPEDNPPQGYARRPFYFPDFPAIRAALCDTLARKLAERRALFAERETLRENYWEAVPQ